jgi:aryl-alcohol dehydrogenase-like predicted oxidoreductase
MQYEVEYEPMVEEYALGVVTYYSLASGFLTGKYRFDEPVSGNRSDAVKSYINSRGRHIIETLTEVADLLSATPAQIALAWLIARPSVTAPIASVSKASQLDILKAVDIKLDSETVSRLNNAAKY